MLFYKTHDFNLIKKTLMKIIALTFFILLLNSCTSYPYNNPQDKETMDRVDDMHRNNEELRKRQEAEQRRRNDIYHHFNTILP